MLILVPPEILARGITALNAYNRALNDGKTLVKRVPIMLIGQDRAGKTSLKKSLKGICFDPKEDSTVGIDIDPSHFKVSTDTWRTGETDQDHNTDTAITFDYQTARHIMWSLKDKGESTSEEENAGTFDSELSKVVVVSDVALDDGGHGETFRDPPPATGGIPPDSAGAIQDDVSFSYSEVPDEVAAVTETLLKGEWEESGEVIYSTLWDFAGQSVYYATHPLFLTKRAIYCLVYDLSLDPDDKAKPVVKQGVYEEIQESFHLKTNFDYLDFWMTSVASLSDCQEADLSSSALPKKLPPVFLVCTHADVPYDGGNPRNLARRIFGRLKSKPYGVHLSDVFFVDNTSLSIKKTDCRQVMRLRQEIHTLARQLPHINEVIPIKWLKFEKALQAFKENPMGNKYISLKSVRDVALQVSNITNHEEFETLMNYLHDLRSLLHYDDSEQLKKVVILDPQWLVDVFKKVITVRPYDPDEKHFLELWFKLEKEGILDEQLLAHVWNPLFKDKETSDSLIGIMERFSLLCPWVSNASSNKEYLVPSMLMSHPPKEVHDLIESAAIPALFIKFPKGHIPVGFFPRLVAQFLQWGKHGFWAQEKPQLFHDFVRFYASGGAFSVILLCHSSSVEVVIHGGNSSIECPDDVYLKRSTLADLPPDSKEVVCARQVCRQLSLILECMRNEFPWLRNMTYEMCVICPVCSGGRVVAFCQTHREKVCKQEQCLHFWRISQLCNYTENITCTRSAVAQNTKVKVMQFSPWFPSPKQQVITSLHSLRAFLIFWERHILSIIYELMPLRLPHFKWSAICFKIMTRYTCGFFPRILAIISATRYTCVFCHVYLRFISKYMTIFLQTRIYMRTKKPIYMRYKQACGIWGHRKLSYKTHRIIPSTKNPFMYDGAEK